MTETRRRCKAKNAQGEPCRMHPNLVSQATYLCNAHAPNGQQEMARRAKLGGRATQEVWHRPGLSAGDLGPLESVADAQRWLRLIGSGVLDRSIDKGDGAIATRAVDVWLKAQDGLTEADVLRLADKADEIKAQQASKPHLRRVG